VAKVDVKVPDIGDFKDIPVIEVLVKPGEVVKVDQSLITLESDKAAMDVPSPVAGEVVDVVAKVGDKVSMGTLVARVESADGKTAKAEAAPAKAAAPEKTAAVPAKASAAPTAKAGAPASAKTAPIEITIPDIGDFTDVPVIEILVKVGDTVEAEQPIVTLESDKASMDVPSPAAGKITKIVVKVGDKVSMGVPVAKLDAGGQPAQVSADQEDEAEAKEEEDAAEAPDTSPVAPRDLPPRPPKAGSGPALPDFSGVFAGPAVRRLARELGLDLNQIKGTGEKGRITREDLKAALSKGAAAPAGGGGALPSVPQVDFAKFGPIETLPLSRIKKISGPRLHASWVNIPHVTHTDEADITDLDAFRKALDEDAKKDKSKPYRVSLLPLLMRAAVSTLKAFPTFNAALAPAGDSLILRRYWHTGVAVDTPDGLVVAVIKDVDQKGVIDLSRELGALSEKARAGKLAPAEMQGATFTISSLGGIGGTAFTPIVNAPEVAILGVVRSKMAPVWDGTAFQPRLMLPLCLSYDHRVVDGAAAARFMRHLAGLLEDMRRIIL
jgi:pyruvate dehydrogenase E2 component (dihydrolipoamide acetyltransferase)